MEWRLGLHRNRCQMAGVQTFKVLPEDAFEGSVNCQSVFSTRHVRFMAEQQLTDRGIFTGF